MLLRLSDVVRVKIDNREIEVAAGSTILDAAEKLGIEIPTMCFMKGCEALTSCMVCLVEVAGREDFLPACGTIVEDGMSIRTDTEQVREARKTALELLLSDHAGDCMGPCQVACPAKMDIALMIRQIAAGRLDDAIVTVKRDIALPAVLGRICPAPCEKVCRRGALDEAVSICLLKRCVADIDLESDRPYVPVCEPAKNKTVAIGGAGPGGLAAAYYLCQGGYSCTVFDEHEKPGGMLRYGIAEDKLPRDVLDAEIAGIEKLGATFRLKTRIGGDRDPADLHKDFDAVVLATGGARVWMLDAGCSMLDGGVGKQSGGRPMAVRAVAAGKAAALAVSRSLSGQTATGPAKPFNTSLGRLKEEEVENLRAVFAEERRITLVDSRAGFTDSQGRAEAGRCMHCDCRKAQSCKLRHYARQYGARARRYGGERRLFEQQPVKAQKGDVIYEPSKCINCGLCIQIASQAGEKIGLSFTGRGFDVRVAVPFEHSVAEGLQSCAEKCVAACPTGALAFMDV